MHRFPSGVWGRWELACLVKVCSDKSLGICCGVMDPWVSVGLRKQAPDFISCLHTTSHSRQQSRFLPSFCPFCKCSYLTVKSIPGPRADLFTSVGKLSLLTWTVYCDMIRWLWLFPSSKEMSSICDTIVVKFALPCSFLLVAVCNWWSAVVQ